MSNPLEIPAGISGLQNPPQWTSELHLGVTGHRDVRDAVEVRKAVVEALDEIVKVCQPPKIVLHNPLADGADRLVLEACEDWGGSDGNPPVSIKVVLPLSKEEYKEAFEKSHRDWLDVQFKKFECTTKILHDPYDANAYERLAVHFRENCNLVLALWDGIDNENPGGTADVVKKLIGTGRKEKCSSVVWIPVARESNPYPAAEKFTRRALFPKEEYASLLPEKSWIEHAQFSRKCLLGVLGLVAVVAGTIGYSDHESKNFAESLVISTSHLFNGSFSFSGNAGYHGFILLSWGAGILFFLLSAGIILNQAFDLFSRADRWLSSKRQHDLIFGLGERGRNLLYASHMLKKPVIAVDIAPDHQAKDICDKAGIPLLIGDSCAPKTIEKLGIPKARKVFICTGTDIVNTRIVHQLAKALSRSEGDNPDTFLKCAVGLKSTDNFATLRQSLPVGHRLDLRIFNREAVTARALLRNVHLDRFSASPDADGASVLIAGTGPMADEMLRQVIQTGHFEDERKLRVARLCEDAESEASKFADRYPCFTVLQGGTGYPVATPENVWLENRVLPPVAFHSLPSSSRGRSEWVKKHMETAGWVTTVFVCDSEPMESARLAEDLAPPLEKLRSGHEQDIGLWFYFCGIHEPLRHDLEKNLDRHFEFLHVESFTDFMGKCDHACAMGQLSDEVARRINGFYWKIPLRREKQDEIASVWSGISEHDRDSSRQAAEHAWVKLRVRNRLRKQYGGERETITKELAKIEHRRWCSELLLKGFLPLTRIPSAVSDWTGPTPDESDLCDRWFETNKKLKNASKIAKCHIDLVPFDDLISLLGEEIGTAEQKKDYGQVEALDRLVGLSGDPETETEGSES